MPALSHYFGVHPWHLDRLTPRELEEYVRQLPRGGDDGTG